LSQSPPNERPSIGAILERTSFEGNLKRATLALADLATSKLSGASIDGADLRRAI
jgi:uncharacterized protein YjbI with pentapeptide repeats